LPPSQPSEAANHQEPPDIDLKTENAYTFEYIRAMPKGDLHVHLNGLIDYQLVADIIRDEHISLPPNFRLPDDLIQREPASLTEYLKIWEILRLLPKRINHLFQLVDSAFGYLHRDGVTFAELRNSVMYISRNMGFSVETALAVLLEAVEASSEKYGVTAGLMLSIPRSTHAEAHFDAVVGAYKNLGCPKLVVGLDMSGDEDLPMPPHLGKKFLAMKHEYGLGITMHAGETGNPDNIVTAVTEYGAQRIGHGTAAGKSPKVMQLLRERDICVEICPISNRLTNAVPKGTHHPVREFMAHGVPFVIGSDNPQVHHRPLSADYLEFLGETGATGVLDEMYATQRRYAFISSVRQ
jgi:adenosine deaminase